MCGFVMQQQPKPTSGAKQVPPSCSLKDSTVERRKYGFRYPRDLRSSRFSDLLVFCCVSMNFCTCICSKKAGSVGH